MYEQWWHGVSNIVNGLCKDIYYLLPCVEKDFSITNVRSLKQLFAWKVNRVIIVWFGKLCWGIFILHLALGVQKLPFQTFNALRILWQQTPEAKLYWYDLAWFIFSSKRKCYEKVSRAIRHAVSNAKNGFAKFLGKLITFALFANSQFYLIALLWAIKKFSFFLRLFSIFQKSTEAIEVCIVLHELQINFKDSFENFIIPSCYAFEVILKGWKPWHFSYLYNNKTTYTMFFCSSIGRTGMNKNGFDLLIKTKAEQPFQSSKDQDFLIVNSS